MNPTCSHMPMRPPKRPPKKNARKRLIIQEKVYRELEAAKTRTQDAQVCSRCRVRRQVDQHGDNLHAKIVFLCRQSSADVQPWQLHFRYADPHSTAAGNTMQLSLQYYAGCARCR